MVSLNLAISYPWLCLVFDYSSAGRGDDFRERVEYIISGVSAVLSELCAQ